VNGPTPAGVVAATGNLPVYGVPGQPTSVAASVAGTTATISWTPPGFTGGIPLTGFTVTAQPGGNTCVVSSGSQTACTMPGLVKGTAYTFTVTATNGFLTSPASTASGSVTVPYTPPGTPTGFTAVRGDQDAALSFTAPADTGGVPITGYQVTTNGGTTWQLITTIAGPGGTLQAALTGLTNGTSYQVAVRAVNVIGAGYSTTAVLVTPITGEPGTPGPVTVSGTTTTTASVHWTAPSITGATPITGYQLQITDHTTGTVRTLTLGPILGTVVTGLTPGDHYTFAAAAVNAAGASLFTNPSTTITTPSPSPTPSPTPTPTPTGGTPPPAVSAAQRAHEVPVPADPNAYRGPQRFTTAYGRSFHGTPAFAIPTLHGYQLHRGQAVTFSSAASSAALFTFNSARLTAPARADIRELVVSLTHAHAVVCEGYTDYQVAPGHARTLSAQRARAVCAAVRAADPHLRVTAIGYGGRRPAVIGGSITRRAANRRIVIDITG
jgi:outer membrane protein OmpA-like peptidoglycan-associated protein